jgi:hypothetical protein
MSQRFQFSLGRLLGSTGLLCLALPFFRLALFGDDGNFVAFIVGTVLYSAASTNLVGRPAFGAICALAVWFAVLMAGAIELWVRS